MNFNKTKEKETVLDAIHLLESLYKDQDKMTEAEKMYQRALEGREKAWGPEYTSTLDIINNLGILYADQGAIMNLLGIFYELPSFSHISQPGNNYTLPPMISFTNSSSPYGLLSMIISAAFAFLCTLETVD